MINDGIEKARQKTFNEARSEVLNAYQSIIEKNLVERLRKKYKAQKFNAPLQDAFTADKKALMASPKLTNNMTPSADQ